MSNGKQVVVLRSMGFVYAKEVREQGEIFSMVAGMHDYTMLKFRHVREVDGNDEAIQCDADSKTFATRMGYELHLTGRIHPQSPNFDEEGRTKLGRNDSRIVQPLAGVSGAGSSRLKANEVPIYE